MQNNDKFWELTTAKLHNETTDEETAELNELLEKDENKKLYKKIESLNKDAQVLGSLSGISQNNSWVTISKHLQNKTIQMVRNILKYAAIIVFAFLLGTVITNQFNKQNEISGFAEVKVPLGQMSEMTLFDGTKVWLNSGTTLRYDTGFGQKERTVSLEGEAFFDVIKDEIPFKVKFKNTEVEVLGTTFNVVSYNDEDYSRVTLVEGKVNINNIEGKKITGLNPSEQITISDDFKNARLEKVNTEFYVSWIEGKIIFDDEKLSEITRKLERWYNVDISFKEVAVGDLRFSGTILKHKPFDQIITAFKLLLPVNIKYKHVLDGKDTVIISKK